MTETKNLQNASASRREFLQTTTAAGAVLLAGGNYAFAQGSERIRVGLIGCGGRGTGAAANALAADPGVVLTAMGDVFQTQLDGSLKTLKAQEGLGARVDVKPDMRFVGLDAYLKVINSGVDVVLLTAPPGFRPQHIKAACAAGKHIFAEKPMGTDAAGVRAALEAVKAAQPNGKCFVSGFCYRYSLPHRAFYKRLQEGAIGPVRHVHATYLTGPVKPMPPAPERPAGMSDTEWQIRNWYNFVWLSGDGLVEQACHSVDKILWAKNDVPPVRCVATGGRDIPNNEGNIFDHIDVFYEFADGTRATMAQRQIPDCSFNDNTDYVIGAAGMGTVHFADTEMEGAAKWKYEGPKPSMYDIEHKEMYAAIRQGKVINDAERMARSTLAGLMGRTAAYTGDSITWEQMLTSKENLFPEHLDWKAPLAIAPLAVPGKTKFV